MLASNDLFTYDGAPLIVLAFIGDLFPTALAQGLTDKHFLTDPRPVWVSKQLWKLTKGVQIHLFNYVCYVIVRRASHLCKVERCPELTADLPSVEEKHKLHTKGFNHHLACSRWDKKMMIW